MHTGRFGGLCQVGAGQHEGRHPWRAVWRPWCRL